MFVDLSGRRGRLVRHAGALAGAVCFGYSAVLGMGFAGGTAIAPETLIPGRPVTTEAFGREPKGAPEGHFGSRDSTHEHPSGDHRYRQDGPDHPQPHPPAAVRPASARKPTALARPAPPQPHRASGARGERHGRGNAARPGRRPGAHHAPRHQRPAAHQPGRTPHHARPHEPASPPGRPAPHKPPRKPAGQAPDPVKRPPAAKPGTPDKPGTPAKPADPGPDRPQNPGNGNGNGQTKPPANEPEAPVWGPSTPGGINWQAFSPFRGRVS